MKSIEDTILEKIKLKVQDPETISEISNRLAKEGEVRKLKKSKLPCHYKTRFGNCYETDIKCLDRQKYADGESAEEKALPHQCNYSTEDENKNILVVDDNEIARKLSINVLVSSGADENNITQVESVRGAISALENGKLNNKPYCLVVTDIKMPGQTGHDLVNHIIERNGPDIVIMSATPNYNKPDYYLGDMSVVPGIPAVSAVVGKPFNLVDVQTMFRRILNTCKKELVHKQQ